MTFNSVCKSIISVVGGFISYYLGGFDLLLRTMLSLTILDFVTANITAMFNGTYSSHASFKGTIKKLYMYLTIVLAVILQNFIGDSIPIRETVIVFYIVSEGISILENIGVVIDYPPKLKQIFEKLRDDENE